MYPLACCFFCSSGSHKLNEIYSNTNFQNIFFLIAPEGNVERVNSMFSNNGQNAKKKRKSRTAFTNKQIFELEKKFLYQRYLTPADRDDLAEKLDLSGAQVITWFQNRRAKSKRDTEEMSKDMQTAKIIQAQMSSHLFYNKALIENSIPNIYESMPNMDLFKAKMHLMPTLAPAKTAP